MDRQNVVDPRGAVPLRANNQAVASDVGRNSGCAVPLRREMIRLSSGSGRASSELTYRVSAIDQHPPTYRMLMSQVGEKPRFAKAANLQSLSNAVFLKLSTSERIVALQRLHRNPTQIRELSDACFSAKASYSRRFYSTERYGASSRPFQHQNRTSLRQCSCWFSRYVLLV